MDIITGLLALLLGGGAHAVTACLLLFIVLLLFERRRMIDITSKKDDKLDRIIDDYYKANITLAEALTALKNLLAEIRSKI